MGRIGHLTEAESSAKVGDRTGLGTAQPTLQPKQQDKPFVAGFPTRDVGPFKALFGGEHDGQYETREDAVHLLQRLDAILSGDVISRVGLCGNTNYSPLLHALFRAWPKFSGDATAPIPHGPDGGYHHAKSAGTLWDRATEYGALRWELTQFVRDRLALELVLDTLRSISEGQCVPLCEEWLCRSLMEAWVTQRLADLPVPILVAAFRAFGPTGVGSSHEYMRDRRKYARELVRFFEEKLK